MANPAPRIDFPDDSGISDRQYRLWKEMLENRTGVRIAPDRDRFARGQIARRMAELDVRDPDTYFREVLETLSGNAEWGLLLDRLLNKETRFFRHRDSFEYLEQRISERLARSELAGTLSAWSVGCSTGEESYSLSMTLYAACNAAGHRPRFGVMGTDISREALQTARRGIYRDSAMTGLSVGEKLRFFVPEGPDHCRVADDLRHRTGFIESNILESVSPPFADAMDIIFCHNVLIYFRRWRRRQVVSRLVASLKVGGLLLVGPGELSDWVPPGLERDRYPGVQAYVRIE
jgi:chemotaxis methyl-accepting protein methylase